MFIFIEFSALLGFFFIHWVIWGFFHTAPDTSCGNLEMLNTVKQMWNNSQVSFLSKPRWFCRVSCDIFSLQRL